MSQQRGMSRVVNVPPAAPGFVGPGHLAAPVVSPENFEMNDPFILLMDDHLDIGWAMLEAENDRKNGWARVRNYLAWAEDDQGRLVREPMWQIFEGPGAPKGLGYPNLIRTLPALVHDQHDPEDVDSDSEDHAPDSAGYGLMTRPKLTVVPLEVMDSEYSEATIRAEHDERASGRVSNFYYHQAD